MSASSNIPPFDFGVTARPALPRRSGLFITGTDTGVGKTLIAGAIARSVRATGRRVAVFKPAAAGCRSARGQLVSEDAQFLAACADTTQMLSEVCPVRYRRAVAPNVAAQREGRPVDLELIFDEYGRISRSVEDGGEAFVVVEGVGGLLCPITDDFWVIHLAKMLALPLVIVARAGLGTINHTLLTLHAARSAGLTVAGVVVNRYLVEPPAGEAAGAGQKGDGRCSPDDASAAGPCFDAELSMQTNPQQIEQRGRVPVLALVPEEPENSVEQVRIGPDTQYVIGRVDWASLGRVASAP